tara:strand:- start:586 stop:834 length:249 start_codon:yes stop_codon:yes gene_type:complete
MKEKNKLCLFLIMSLFILTCSKDINTKNKQKSDCQKIKDLVTDCMGLHRGAFDYINNCGDISYEKVNSADTCEEVFKVIEED